MSPGKVSAWIESADVVVAADSGMLRVLEAGFVPDIVVGDFDSISIDMVDPKTITVIDQNQEDTDCAKLLSYCQSQGHFHVTLICAEGDMSDHFLDTVHCSVRTDLSVTIGLERGRAHILKGPFSGRFATNPGARVSFLPLESIHHASMSGVQWEFSDRTLSVRGFTSISNLATESEVNLSFESGAGYLFIESTEPFWPTQRD